MKPMTAPDRASSPAVLPPIFHRSFLPRTRSRSSRNRAPMMPLEQASTPEDTGISRRNMPMVP